MGEFKHGLFGCFDNCGICIITYFLPCITAGRNAAIVDENCFLCGFLSILGPVGIYTRAKIRGMIREKAGIDGSFGNDCIMAWCCGPCALVQEAQEFEGAAMGESMARE